MKSKRKHLILWLSLIIMLTAITTSVGCWASSTFHFTIENRTEHILTIYLDSHQADDISPGGQIEYEFLADIDKYSIKAKTSQGEVIYSREWTKREMRDADFKLVISSPPNNSSLYPPTSYQPE